MGAACALQRSYRYACERLSLPVAPMSLVGHSAGAQFAHRFAMAFPERVRALAIASAGWYTMPDPGCGYPFGAGPSLELPRGMGRLEQFLRLPILVLVGERDVERDSSLRTSPFLDRQQGVDRVDRARGWVRAVNSAASAQGLPPPAALELMPGCAHSLRDCITRGNLPSRVAQFLEGNTPLCRD